MAAIRKNSTNGRPTPHSVLTTTDELVVTVPWGRWRSVLVYRRQHSGRTWVRMRTFNKHRTNGHWYPSPRFFVVPLECAAGLAEAIAAAASGEVRRPEPDWYRDFEREYAARRAAVSPNASRGTPGRKLAKST